MKEDLLKMVETMDECEIVYAYTFLSKLFGKGVQV